MKALSIFLALILVASPAIAQNAEGNVMVVSVAPITDVNSGRSETNYVTVPDCSETVDENCIPSDEQNEIAAAQLNNLTPAAKETP